MLIIAALIIIGSGLTVFFMMRNKKRDGNQQAVRKRGFKEPFLRDDIDNESHDEDVLTTKKIKDDKALGLAKAEEEVAPSETTAANTAQQTIAKTKFVAFHLIAENEYPYNGYELMQTMLSSGLRFGNKKIFHFHHRENISELVLFSVASINEPGTFDLASMGSYTCPGLTLFMVVEGHKAPVLAFDKLVQTVRQLHEDLGGELLDHKHEPLNMDKVAVLRKKLKAECQPHETSDMFVES